MKYIDKDGEALVEITVDVDKLDKYSSVADFQVIPPNYKRPQYYTTTINLGLTVRDKVSFRQKLKEILTNNVKKKGVLSDQILDAQFDELIFMWIYLKTWHSDSYEIRKQYPYEVKFRQIYNAINLVRQVDHDDELKILVIKKKVDKATPTLLLPKAKDTKLLYEYIYEAIKKYFLDHENEFGLKYYLTPYKNKPLNPEVYHERVKILDSAPKAITDSKLGNYTNIMLSYMKFLPQFPSSKRENTLMSEPQAEFIINYLQLFGFHNQSFKINLEPQQPFTTKKELRRTIERFRKKFVHS